MSGLSLGDQDTPLTRRAADFLAAGPADSETLIRHVCQTSGSSLTVAEHMAAAMFAGHQRFVRATDGRWMLRGAGLPEHVPSFQPPERGGTLPRARVVSEAGAAYSPSLAARSLHDEPFVVVDVETTGSSVRGGDRITEVAVVRVQHGVATTVFETLIDPQRPIPSAVVNVTNITAEMVRNAPRFRDVCPQLLAALEGHVFVAHNANFDWRFIATEIERATHRPLQGRRLCTVRLAQRVLPQLRRRNLDALQYFYGIENPARHRAGGDARATAAIFLRLLDAAADRGWTTLDDLDLAVSRGTSRRKKRRRRPPALPHSVTDDSSA